MSASLPISQGDGGFSNAPLHIAHYIPAIRLEQGGVVRSILDWCQVLSQRGHQMTLITYQGNDVPTAWCGDGAGKPRAYTVPPPNLPGKPLGLKAMQIAEDAIRDVQVLHLHAPWLDGNRQMGNLARRRGIPYVVSTHGMLDDWAMNQRGFKKKLYMAMFGRRFLNRAAAIHCTAEGEQSQASKWFDNSNVAVLPALMDLTEFEKMPGPESGLALLPEEHREKPRILFLSRLHEQKGVDILIRAAALLRDAGQEFVLMIAGNGDAEYERYLRELARSLKLETRVFFLGLVTGTQKISLYQSADLFALPTRHENFGLVLTEALAAGTPVVTTRGTDIWPEIQQAGGAIAEATARGIADAIADLLSHRSELSALGERGRKWAFETLAVAPLASKYETLYRSVIATAASATVTLR